MSNARKYVQVILAVNLVSIALFTLGCSEPADTVWLNPEKTVVQAEDDMEKCYFEAFLAQRQNPAPDKFPNLERDPKAKIESAAGECMKRADYKKIAAAKIKPPIQTKSGVAHTMDYSVAGKQ